MTESTQGLEQERDGVRDGSTTTDALLTPPHPYPLIIANDPLPPIHSHFVEEDLAGSSLNKPTWYIDLDWQVLSMSGKLRRTVMKHLQGYYVCLVPENVSKRHIIQSGLWISGLVLFFWASS